MSGHFRDREYGDCACCTTDLDTLLADTPRIPEEDHVGRKFCDRACAMQYACRQVTPAMREQWLSVYDAYTAIVQLPMASFDALGATSDEDPATLQRTCGCLRLRLDMADLFEAADQVLKFLGSTDCDPEWVEQVRAEVERQESGVARMAAA